MTFEPIIFLCIKQFSFHILLLSSQFREKSKRKEKQSQAKNLIAFDLNIYLFAVYINLNHNFICGWTHCLEGFVAFY